VSVEELHLRGVLLLRGERFSDERGDFRVHLDAAMSAQVAVGSQPAKVASAYNARAGTIRGMHYQVEPFPEFKTMWCSAGAVLDVLVDVRANEPTYGQWISVRLDDDAVALHVPPGIAHGYQTLADHSVVTYLIQGAHDPASARTLLWNDPHVAVDWPLEATILSANDREGAPWPPRP